jgi:thiosulfate/3-mercaptopyruvate sulfurtransferase
MSDQQAAEPSLPDALVSTGWLAARLGAPDVRVVDASFKMPGVTPTAEADYRRQHIPGAVFFDIDDIADSASTLPHMLPAPEKFASRMRKLSLGDGNRIILYDANGVAGAARAWWMLRVFGHHDVSVLDGGLRKWLVEGRPVDDLPPMPRERHFTARLNTLMVRDKDQVLADIASRREQILDARASSRFIGEAAEPWPGRLPGHIPGSRNLDHASLIDTATGTFKPVDALAGLFAAAGVDPNRPVVTSCGSGITACVLALGLHLIGRRDIAVYDGSWAEWGLPENRLPIETGPVRD